MRYRVFFTTGKELSISEDRYLSLVGIKVGTPMAVGEESYINLQHVTHIIPEPEPNEK